MIPGYAITRSALPDNYMKVTVTGYAGLSCRCILLPVAAPHSTSPSGGGRLGLATILDVDVVVRLGLTYRHYGNMLDTSLHE